jgi:phage-related protein
MQTSFSKWSKLMGAGAIMMVAVAGCTGSDTNGDGKTADSPEGAAIQNSVDSAQNSATNAMSNADEVASNVAKAAGNQVQGASNAVSNAVPEVVGAGRTAVMTPNVKDAILGKIPGANIDVDTNGTTKTITLKGMVKNAAQSKLAADAAKKEAPDYKIVNNLKVGGGASPVMKR